MLNTIKALVKREIIINYKLLVGRLPLVLIILVTIPFFSISVPTIRVRDILILFGFTLNILFAITFLSQIYLQELKDNEIKFLLTFMVDKSKIVISKIIYILIIISILNLMLAIPEFLIFNSIIIFTNIFLLNIVIGFSSGLLLLSAFLMSNYEFFLNITPYIRGLIIFSVFALSYLFKFISPGINKSFNFNPLLSFSLLIIMIIGSNSLLQKLFKHY